MGREGGESHRGTRANVGSGVYPMPVRRPLQRLERADPMQPGAHAVIDLAGFGQLLDLLRASGYRLIGPVRRDGGIVYEEIASAADLPGGWTEEQGPGTYRLQRRGDRALFGYATTPDSWKRTRRGPVLRLWQGRRGNRGPEVAGGADGGRPRGLLSGPRPRARP